jgi:hypothetical protein
MAALSKRLCRNLTFHAVALLKLFECAPSEQTYRKRSRQWRLQLSLASKNGHAGESEWRSGSSTAGAKRMARQIRLRYRIDT